MYGVLLVLAIIVLGGGVLTWLALRENPQANEQK